MTIRSLFAPLAALLLATVPAHTQQAAVTMDGTCAKLVIGGQDITQNCKQALVGTVARNRSTFDFAALDGQTLSFSGTRQDSEATHGSPLSVSLVVPGRKDKDAIIRNPAPAAGSCTVSSPEASKTTIACEATSRGKTYAGTFVTDAKTPDAAPKP